MNKSTVINLISFAAGAAIGAIVATKIANDKVEARIEEEVSAYKAYIDEKNGITHDEPQPDDEVVTDGEFDIAPKTIKYKRQDPATDYTGFYNKPDIKDLAKKYGDTDEEYEIEEPEPEEEVDASGMDDVYVISYEEFSESREDYDKITIEYYEKDDTLVDERQEILPDDTLCDEAFQCFGQDSNDPDIVYVRNDKLSTDFEVVRVDKSYSIDILGLDVEEPQKHRKPKKVSDEDE